MLGRRGMTWLVVATGVVLITLGVKTTLAQSFGIAGFPSGYPPLALLAVSGQTSMEAQMTGERPLTSTAPQSAKILPELAPLLEKDREGLTLRLPQNFRISFRYSHERSAGMAEHLFQPPLLFKYSMEYRLLPNLQVGMSGFLYQPPQDHLTYLQQRRTVLGWGPKLSYDLGRWTFAFQTQMERGLNDGTPGLQNWLRIWYAF